MSVRCSLCVNFTMKGQMKAGLGLFHCAVKPPYFYFNPHCERECAEFKQVPDEEMPARIKWEGTQPERDLWKTWEKK